ncbi:MAG TPA: D-aminoacylase [Woeseiaceae bacterium]|nr:D-aminoacylase [Woeseiaceae bacterium]
MRQFPNARRFRPIIAVALGVALGAAACTPESRPGLEPLPDTGAVSLLIRDVRIVDGTGASAFAGDVRISGDRIVDVGDLERGDGDVVFEGGGLTLAPGFIDTHSHAERDLLDQPDALPAVSQGITTVVAGQDGGSEFPLADFFAEAEATPAAINIASYVGHNTLRSEVLGEDFRRKATDAEIESMASILERELESGALGLSSGLEYEPGIHSDPAEVLALAKLTAASGGRYISHVRSEDRWFEQALDEIINIGRVTGMPVQVSHIKLAMKRLWGEAPRFIATLDAARADGVRISADIYPYEYWQSDLMVLLPERDYTDRAAVAEALDQIAPPDGLWMTQFDPQPEYVGKTLTEIAALRDIDTVTAFMQLAEESAAMEEQTGRGTNSIIGTSMREDDIHEMLLWPETNICTDGAFEDLHPRARGAFTRVLGRYVREQKLLSLEQAVHKMTGLAAAHMGFDDRGVIRAGARADLVLFDPDTVIDRATPDDPELLSEGIATVWVGGLSVYENGRATGARPGKVIRRSLE